MAQASTTFPGTTDQDMLIVQALDRLDTQGQDPFGEAYGPVARKDGGTGCQLAFVRTCLQLGLLSREHAHQLLASNGDTTALESPRPDKARLAESLRSTQSKQRQLIDELTASTSAVNVRAEVLVEV